MMQVIFIIYLQPSFYMLKCTSKTYQIYEQFDIMFCIGNYNKYFEDRIMRNQEQEYKQVPITGSEHLQSQFSSFLLKAKQSKSNLKGNFFLQNLPYNPLLIDNQSRPSFFKRLTSSNSNYTRSFLIYIPQFISTQKKQKQIVVLLHGTNQDVLNTQLVIQEQTNENDEKICKFGWMELADREELIIVVPQSRGLVYRNKKYYGWQPGNEDTLYLLQILNLITSQNYLQSKIINQFRISKNNISIVGFSNGGLFSSDLYLHYTLAPNQLQKPWQFHISSFINFMRGIELQLSNRQSLCFDEKLKETSIVIMSCKKDENYGPCLRAYQFFQAHQCNACFVDVNQTRHTFGYQSIQTVYQFIQASKQVHGKDEMFQLNQEGYKGQEMLEPMIKNK